MELRVCLECRQLLPRGQTRCALCQGQVGVVDAWSLLGSQLGRYRLIELLGAGGMGIVFGAEHSGLGRRVALKLLLPELDGGEFVERFRREARLLAELHHPHIVDVLDFEVSASGLPYYVMERLEGCSLASALARHACLRPGQLARLLVQVGAALDHAHRRQVVHRDLKPDNIYLARAEGTARAKLLDFGIAKRLGPDPAGTALTGTGAMLGTPLYLTPEQIAGAPVDARTDQYALALIVIECLSGRPARHGLSMTEILYLAQHDPISASSLPAEWPSTLRAALQKATDPDPTRRHSDIPAFLAALELPAPGPGPDEELLSLLIEATPTPLAATVPVLSRPAHAATPPVASTTPLPPALPALQAAAADSGAPGAIGHPPAARLPVWRQRRLQGLVLLVLLVLLVGWLLLPSSLPDPGPDPQAQASRPFLREIGRQSTPADAGALLGVGGSGPVLRTAGGVYLLAGDGQRPAARRGDAPGERVLGVDESGALLLQREGKLLAVDPRGQGERALLDLPEALDPPLALRSDGRALLRIAGERLLLHQERESPRELARVEASRVQRLLLGREGALLQLAAPLQLRWLVLDGSGRSWEADSALGRVHDLAWDEDRGRVALCGFAPQVELHALETVDPAQSLAVSGSCYAATWLPGGQTLLLRNEREILLWNDAERERIDWPLRSGGVGVALPGFAIDGAGLWINEPGAGLLLRLALGAPAAPPLAANQGSSEIWDLLALDGRVLVAHSDGTLASLEGGTRRPQRVHEAGITDLVAGRSHLASASDDRTLAAWRREDLGLTWRSRGHAFLVNQLWLSADESALWSSSSDGSLKRWHWPTLELAETLDLRELLRRPDLSLHALWFSSDQDQALIGSWNHSLLHLRLGSGGWHGRAIAIASSGGYRILPLDALDALILLGIHPTRLYLWDRRTQALHALPHLGLKLFALAAGSEPSRFFVAGSGAAAEYQLRRDAQGRFESAWRVHLQTALGTIGAADSDPEAARWWLGNAEGLVRELSWQALPEPASPWRRLAVGLAQD